jgi:hypothetical protein
MMASTTTSRYILLAALLSVAAQAWSDSSASEYTFTQSISLDPEDDGAHESDASSSVLSCSSSYDGEFLVTSMMINGGGDCLSPFDNYFSDFDDDDSEDDDDDDDNDGHSSMLSNTSLRRSLASANGGGSSRPRSSKQDKRRSVIPTGMNSAPPTSSRRAFGLPK